MSERSDPLGPPAQVFPVKEYTLVSPNYDIDAQDLVRMELLSLRSCQNPPVVDKGPRWFDARLTFAIDGASWPLRLAFDVNFIHAWPCSDGPHPLFYDYLYDCVRADELVDIKDWNGLYGGHPEERDARSLSPASAGGSAGNSTGQRAGAAAKSTGNLAGMNGGKGLSLGDDEKVLVVEAFGVPDNEVLARAWCAHWGLSAVVADVSKTCMACAIREAYAATLTVLILVDDGEVERDDD